MNFSTISEIAGRSKKDPGNLAVRFHHNATTEEVREFLDYRFGNYTPQELVKRFGVETFQKKRGKWLAAAHCESLGEKVSGYGGSVSEATERLVARIIIQD